VLCAVGLPHSLRSQLLEIICLSDTHELHRDVRVPDGDMLIYAGDITFFSKNPSVLTDFNDWLGELPHRYKVAIPGNHDRLLEQPKHQRTITNAHLLINAGIELGRLKIWGSPVTPYADTAFGIPTAEARVKHWELMPTGLDILITHGPPLEVLDCAPGQNFHGGCPQLRDAVVKKHPRLHVFGHVHGGYGTLPTLNTMFANAALAGELGDLDKPPMRFRFAAATVN
jgi:Icc-related predicted phosphoesterase